MSAKSNKGSFLARVCPELFSFLNDKNVDQAEFAKIEKEAQDAISAGIEAGLENPESLEEPAESAAAEDDELTKLKAQVAQLENTNASLKSENAKFKTAHKTQVAAGVALPNEDASVRNAQQASSFAADSPMGIALAHFKS